VNWEMRVSIFLESELMKQMSVVSHIYNKHLSFYNVKKKLALLGHVVPNTCWTKS